MKGSLFPWFIWAWIFVFIIFLNLMNILNFWEPVLFILSLNIVKSWRVYFYVFVLFFIFKRNNVLIWIWQIIYEFDLSKVVRNRINVKQSFKAQILLMNFFYWYCLINSLRRFNRYLNKKMDYILHWFLIKFENWCLRKWLLNCFKVKFSVWINSKVPFKPESFQLKVASLKLQNWNGIIIFFLNNFLLNKRVLRPESWHFFNDLTV